MLKRFVFAALLAASASPAMAETTKPAEGAAAKAAAESKNAASSTAASKPAAADAAADKTKADGEKKTEKKLKELTPEEIAAAAEAKAKAMGLGEPRALITDVLGYSEPQIESFDELGDGASVLLEAKAELSVLFYPTCEDLMIRGGRIEIAGDKLTIKDGELVSREKGECPGDVALSPAQTQGPSASAVGNQ